MLDYGSLDALTAVLREGSFDRAAEKLNVTPSAISQRIKLLEERLGTVLVIRAAPCRPTEAGLRLWRHVDEVRLLEGQLASELPGVATRAGLDGRFTLRIATNADSLSSWLLPALAAFSAKSGHLLDIAIDDQDCTAEWLKTGEVLAAVTADGKPVQGCRLTELGSMRYRATASPDFVARHFTDGITPQALSAAPALTFNQKDNLQKAWISLNFEGRVKFPTHWLPSSQGFVAACLSGMGWCLNPALLVDPLIAEGRLVELLPGKFYDVPLYWQAGRLASTAIDSVSAQVIEVARRELVGTGAESMQS